LILHDRQRAEDITQDAFIQLYSHWRVSRYERPGAWVRRVAIRLAVRHQNRERIRAVLDRNAEPPAGRPTFFGVADTSTELTWPAGCP
jgi:RNA polymerase sigma-70 factor (ECF subfamily)